MERVKGIEPSSQPWEGHILPLNHTRIGQTLPHSAGTFDEPSHFYQTHSGLATPFAPIFAKRAPPGTAPDGRDGALRRPRRRASGGGTNHPRRASHHLRSARQNRDRPP